jgi:hypothetical protein
MKRLRLDWARLGLATAAGGALAVIIAIALLRHARSTPHVGPTSATLDEAFSELVGLGVGLFAGSALASILVRWGSPFVAGLTVGVVTYSLVAAPYMFVTSDVGPGETWTFVLALFFFYFLTFVILGASLGWGISDIRRRAKTAAHSGR